MTIGQRIKARREELGLTQEELAKKVGYASRSSINKLELSRDLPSKKIALMAEALDTSPAYIMGWVSNPDPDYPNTLEGTNEQNSGRLIEVFERFRKQQEEAFRKAGLNYDEVNEALALYEKYQKAIPQVQAAVETLLKDSQSDA